MSATTLPQGQEEIATSDELYELFDVQSYCCALSGVPLNSKTMELDHKIPRSEGGSDSAENLQWLDPRVHAMKGVLSNEEFIRLCCRVADYSRRVEC